MKLPLWKRSANYIGETWEGWHVFLSRNRDSDCLENSNFEFGWAAVKVVTSEDSVPGDEDDSETVQSVIENHWACGWVEWIAIHSSDTKALAVAEAIMDRLESYPVLDEEDFSNREQREAELVWKTCYSDKERVELIRSRRSEFELDSLADMLGCARGKYFAGYPSTILR